MTEMRPPVLATWLLKHAARGNDALVGDLFEEHRRRRSNVWYWRQVLTAVVVSGVARRRIGERPETSTGPRPSSASSRL